MTKRKRKGGRLGLVAGMAVIATGFGYLVYGGIGESLIYFVTPSELVARGDAAYDSPVRLSGAVVPGTVVWDADALDLRFHVGDGATSIPVHSAGAPPQMFRAGIEVVVEGRYNREGVFESRNLMVKHSNEYRAAEEGERPQEMYRQLMREGRQ